MTRIGLLLDFDGTIIDDIIWEKVDADKWISYLSENLGTKVSKTEFRRFTGMNGKRSWELLQENLDVSKKRYWNVFSVLQAELKKEQLKNGILETCDLEKLRKVKNKAIVSNSPQKTLKILLKYLELEKDFVTVVGPSRFHEHRYMKPDTFLLERAMEKFDSEFFIMVGNSWRDKKAAEKAKIPWRTVKTLEDTNKILDKYG